MWENKEPQMQVGTPSVREAARDLKSKQNSNAKNGSEGTRKGRSTISSRGGGRREAGKNPAKTQKKAEALKGIREYAAKVEEK